MPEKNKNPYSNLLKTISICLFALVLSACGSSYPKLTQFKAFDERFNTTIDTKDSTELAEFSELFFERIEADDALDDLNFIYLFDVTTAEGSSRWRCSKNGFCQERVQGAQPQTDIYYLERYKELYDKSNFQ